MTVKEGKRTKQAFQEYRFKALLSVLTDEQREHFNVYIKEHLTDYKSTISKLLAPSDVMML
ncbi:hypothetical protein [Pedobacter sp.]|uniref:hypothetical protein n=1 Tax=Pedobacter sp. TaxID=1411316 RepID=UPI0031D93386